MVSSMASPLIRCGRLVIRRGLAQGLRRAAAGSGRTRKAEREQRGADRPCPAAESRAAWRPGRVETSSNSRDCSTSADARTRPARRHRPMPPGGTEMSSTALGGSRQVVEQQCHADMLAATQGRRQREEGRRRPCSSRRRRPRPVGRSAGMMRPRMLARTASSVAIMNRPAR